MGLQPTLNSKLLQCSFTLSHDWSGSPFRGLQSGQGSGDAAILGTVLELGVPGIPGCLCNHSGWPGVWLPHFCVFGLGLCLTSKSGRSCVSSPGPALPPVRCDRYAVIDLNRRPHGGPINYKMTAGPTNPGLQLPSSWDYDRFGSWGMGG